VPFSSVLREESGFGLVELLIAMTVMVVGITAIVAGLSSGIVAVKRAGDESTAAAVADAQMEAYRALPNCAIYLDTATIPGSAPYVTDAAFSSTQITSNTPLIGSSTCGASPGTLTDAQQDIQGADGRFYKVNTYIVTATSTGAAEDLAKKVTLVVYDPQGTKTMIRETATFAPPTGCDNPAPRTSVGC
jgi:type II secretory pathway pseudopilin PulG